MHIGSVSLGVFYISWLIFFVDNWISLVVVAEILYTKQLKMICKTQKELAGEWVLCSQVYFSTRPFSSSSLFAFSTVSVALSFSAHVTSSLMPCSRVYDGS